MDDEARTHCATCNTAFAEAAVERVEFWAADFPKPIIMKIKAKGGLKPCPTCVPSVLHFLIDFKPIIDKLCARYFWVNAHVIMNDGTTWGKVARWQFDENLN